ncbi:MAG: trimeric intracellular cation channel family protein [Acidimicrobiales bacterium]
MVGPVFASAIPILSVPMWVQLVAVVFGGISGTIVGRRSEFDLAGVVALAIVTGLGGGIVRDILLQHGPPLALRNNDYILVAVATGLFGAGAPTTIASLLTKIQWPFTLLDAIFVAIYGAISADMALQLNLPAAPCVMIGVIGGVGGSVLRDVFANNRPELFRPGTLYAVPTALGISLYVFVVRVLNVGNWFVLPAMAFIVILRMVAVWRRWSLPEVADDVYLFAQLRTRVKKINERRRRQS